MISQTIEPKEIIVVDDSDNDETFRLIEQRRKDLKEINIELKYIKNSREKSSAIARNIGIDAATGEIIIFLDDDVILMNDYIEHILEVYQNYPDCVGVQGYIIQKDGFSKLNNILCKLTFRSYTEKNTCRVLPSMGIVHPRPLNKISKCEWMAGSNQSYRAHILHEFKFDENLKRYSWMEDVDFSYGIYKYYNGGLYMTPYAKLIHNISSQARMPEHSLIYMKEVHSTYLFFKHFDNTPKNMLIFLWSKLTFLLLKILILIIRPHKDTSMKILHIKYLLEAYLLCLKYIKEIKNGNLSFLQEFINR